MAREIDEYRGKKFSGRSARLFREWEAIDEKLKNSTEISYIIRKRNAEGLPIVYEVIYNIESFCNVSAPDENGLQKPLKHNEFFLRINIPNNYPSVDSKLEFMFRTTDNFGKEIPHPWHPNIRFFGDFAGRVCLNTKAYGTFVDLAHYIERITAYLRYDKYHAQNIPPFPEDTKVAEWVLTQAEPNGWIKEFVDSNL
ncbi:hypothetical protein LJC68_00175 [Bacteroidales bacterium OttesenSCG-928-B11]|nr:hypothetical protein [Bacteroidales bacterium OttesenSCG-928-E04]MDL2308416.1 hypothetical protein [Bacteroidales bacterium OttesenSCG-928-C03]MDL2311280.1 hypothetical protein [Bacteroidales bacterium OttesenSCG-928-B11]MDL2326854.1 hypothetical protein [Bacteroidales bacterium OttesenSCG-928-A14]